MNLFQSIILGIIQGLTEFLPVSSSAHLVIAPYLLSWNIPAEEAFIFDVLVQVATLVAVFAYFWSDLKLIAGSVIVNTLKGKPLANPMSRLGWYILLGCIPAGVLGLILKELVEKAFDSPFATALFLLGTAGLLLMAEFIGKRNRRLDQMTWKDALWVGFFQAIAIFPGISRSGSTIVGGMTRNLDRYSAARFSFLMSIPIMLAVGLLEILDLVAAPNFTNLMPVFLPGFLASSITGYLAIRWFLGFLTRHPLYFFAFYCIGLSFLTLIVYNIR